MTTVELLNGRAFDVSEDYAVVTEKYRLARSRSVGTKRIELTAVETGGPISISVYALATWSA